jgi:two-component system CheB/CheR fusion protein
MAGRKRTTKRSKDTKPARRLPRNADPPEGPETTPAAAGPRERAPERRGPPVAGIGASAGGLEAFKKLFAAMPSDSGIAFCVGPPPRSRP